MTLDGKRIKAFFEAKGKRREWLADQLGCGRDVVDRMLAGKAPRAETLVKLANVMGCQVEDLVAPDKTEVAAKRSA